MVDTASEAAERFLQSPLMADAPPSAREALLGAVAEERVPPGAVLVSQGQPNNRLIFLIGGTTVVERRRPDGRVEAMTTIAAPSVFGTTSFFSPRPPWFTVKAATEVWLLTLGHGEHERLRRDHPHAAEALALASLRVLAERFERMDQLFSQYIAEHPDDHPKVTEWAGFRARLFESPGT